MKLTCSQSELTAALALVGRAVSGRPTHPILANVLLTADAATGRLNLTGYDLSLGIHTSIAASAETSGATTVPARLFGEIVSRLPGHSPVTLAVTGDTDQLQLTSLSGSYQVRSMPADDYPDLPLAQNGAPITLPSADLIRGLRATLFASSNDESKQLLTGVHLTMGAATKFAATDGHRLAVLELPGVIATTETAITVPATALRELERLLSGTGAEAVEMFTERGQIVFVCGDQVLTSRSLDGTYPAYGQLIPGGFNKSITVARKYFVAALERVAVVADQHNNVVKITADPDREELQITADAQDVGSGAEVLAAEVKGEAIVIAFNVRYLLDGLKAMAADEVVLQCNAPTTPVVIGGEEGFTYLVMPVQVRS
jgi:DNA polymerase-3 subunit beta